MKTVFVLKDCNPINFTIPEKKPKVEMVKNKYDIINPGRPARSNNAGGVTRVIQRGELYDKDGNTYDQDCGKPCWYCRHPFEGKAMGIPVRVARTGAKPKIYMDGVFCSYSCAFAYLLDELDKVPERRNPNYSRSKTLMHQLFKEEFPGAVLIPAHDWRLLKDVGNGNMSWKDWSVTLTGIRLVQHPNYTFTPVTITYDIINGKN